MGEMWEERTLLIPPPCFAIHGFFSLFFLPSFDTLRHTFLLVLHFRFQFMNPYVLYMFCMYTHGNSCRYKIGYKPLEKFSNLDMAVLCSSCGGVEL